VCDLEPKHPLIVAPQAYSRMIVTCSTFALYTSFTKFANQALAAGKNSDNGQVVNKRWGFMKKFESDFNHW
jgi:gamma-tubulin complex component 2